MFLALSPIFFAQAQIAPQTPIKILLVPGHDNESWGAQYGNLKEAAMNLAVATRVYDILKKDKRFEVYITRDKNGYTKEFADYFVNHKEDVLSFKESARAQMESDVASGSFVPKDSAPHNNANADTALRLYGFNKWANENKIDAVVHMHFNDRSRSSIWAQGKEKGFAIYIPEAQMVNSKGSAILGANIFLQLEKKYVTSTYEKEKGGLVPDQKLIALGANGTLLSSVRSILVEYGYIYRFGNSANRPGHYTNMANLTATGIKNYFFLK